jgi:uncharacterized protein (TIGR00299 family) protein
MKLLYLDCGMGAAGDMLCAALLELFDDPDAVTAQLNGLGIPGVRFIREAAVKCGIQGTHMRVLVEDEEEDEHLHDHHGHHHHHHSHLEDIRHIVSHLAIDDAVRQDVLSVYDRIAQAESQVHGVTIEHIHFHEVGTMDAIADITAVCYLMRKLGVSRVAASPVHVGSGQVKCAHGILPVPAPATALLLKDVPIYGGEVRGELCTPTGAALLKHFVHDFGAMPVMQLERTGYGMGKKDFPIANCVRAMLGSTCASAGDEIVELRCNLDDMTGEAIGFACEQLLAAGALDVFTTAITMKKSRPGVLLSVLCKPEQRETVTALLFHHTTTLGIRYQTLARSTLERRTEQAPTPYGTVRYKISTGYGAEHRKPEYEDLARIAREKGLSLQELIQTL